MNAIVKFFETYPLTRQMIFKGLEAALIVFSATLFYIINVFLKYDIMNFHPFLKKYYTQIALSVHLLFMFVIDVLIVYTFFYVFDVSL